MKYKQFLIGFFIGALLFTFIPVSAAVQEYILTKSNARIIVDGTEFTDDTLPILNYKGYNYIPAAVFRGICAKLGFSFDWVGETNEIQIQTKGEGNLSDTIGQALIEYKTIDGNEYVSIVDVKAYCEKVYDDKFNMDYGIKYPTWAKIHSVKGLRAAMAIADTKPDPTSEEELIKSGVTLELPIEVINGEIHITRETFENTVLPFIDKWEEKIKGGF